MKVLIDIPDQLYKDIKNGIWCANNIISNAIEIGTPIPNATNGDVIKVLFPHEEICKGPYGYDLGDVCTIDFDWMNVPYQKGGK